jgi:hypothetical protein
MQTESSRDDDRAVHRGVDRAAIVVGTRCGKGNCHSAPCEIGWSKAIGAPASLVTVCEPLTPFQVTVVPTFTVSVAGEN